jgi:crotonobetainyl-CoA:carnitine CoA-transferase CaiB-like acyl-CoA transferase
MIVEVDATGAGAIRMAGVPVKLSESAGSVRSGPPALGEHTRAVVESLGYSPADIERLEHAGAIASC